jgi:hypothetical protein
MPSPHELSGGGFESPYSAEVALRNTDIGDHAHHEREIEFTKQLEELADAHPGLINPDKIAMAAEREGQAAGEKAIQEREAGLMNDEYSQEPGIFITGRLDYRKIEMLRDILEQSSRLKDEYLGESRLEVDDIAQIDILQTLGYRLHLPSGVFTIPSPYETGSQENLLIFTRGNIRPFGEVTDPSLNLQVLTGGYFDQHNQNTVGVIGRIEGAGGRLWQNPEANPDGSPKDQ